MLCENPGLEREKIVRVSLSIARMYTAMIKKKDRTRLKLKKRAISIQDNSINKYRAKFTLFVAEYIIKKNIKVNTIDIIPKYKFAIK